MAEPIDPALARRLDAYTVPPLPSGFADRLVAVALEGSSPEVSSAQTALPTLRRPAPRRWLRGGAMGLGAIALGMISISAAAMGYFGEPIRHAVQQTPVVGKVIERVLPRSLRLGSLQPASHEAPARVAKPAVPQVPATEIAVPVLEDAPASRLTPIERRQRLRSILADPVARQAWVEAHPRAAERIALRRAEFRSRRAEAGLGLRHGRSAGMPADGHVRPMLRREQPGPTARRERIEQMRERRRQMREQRGMLRRQGYLPPPPEPQA